MERTGYEAERVIILSKAARIEKMQQPGPLSRRHPVIRLGRLIINSYKKTSTGVPAKICVSHKLIKLCSSGRDDNRHSEICGRLTLKQLLHVPYKLIHVTLIQPPNGRSSLAIIPINPKVTMWMLFRSGYEGNMDLRNVGNTS
jgi:hypothetical protein